MNPVTLTDLERILARKNIGSATFAIAANGKVSTSLTVRDDRDNFASRIFWSDNIGAGLSAALADIAANHQRSDQKGDILGDLL